MRNYLFFADTPFQIFNCAVLTYNVLEADDKADLIVYDQFTNCSEYVDRFKEVGCFRHIHVIGYNPSVSLSTSRIDTLKLYASRHAVNPYMTDHVYDFFCFSCPTSINFNQIKHEKEKNDDLKIIMYEDGNGSYSPSMFGAPFLKTRPFNKRYTLYNKISYFLLHHLVRKEFRFIPQRMYVYDPSLVTYDAVFPFEKIHFSDAIRSRFKQLFCNESAISQKISHCVVILDVPRPGNGVENEARCIDEVIGILSERHIPYVVRRHPRTIDARYYANGERAFSSGLWEIICLFAEFRSCVLVSAFSTASLTPCTIAGRRPDLIFLTRLAHRLSPASPDHPDVCLAKKAYRDASKVHAPSSMDELLSIVRSVI